jgi:DNA-binding transcriptional MerR regulator
VELLRFILEEWERISGVSRQRMGEIGQYEGKGTTEQSIIQSSHITEDYYRKFSFFEQRDLQCLIDYSQIAWINGKKEAYIMPDGTQDYLDVDPDTYTHAEFGVFVSDATKEVQKLNQLKALGQAGIQNGIPMSMIADILDGESFVEIKDKITQAEKYMEQLQQQAQELEQQMAQAEQQEKQAEREHQSIENEKDRYNKIELELIKQQMKDTSDEDWKAELESKKIQLEEKIKTRELSEKERSNKANERLKDKEIKVKAKTTNKKT